MSGLETGRRGPGGRARRWLRRASALYGWRLYAIPVLVAITAAVIVHMVRTPPRTSSGSPEVPAAGHPAPATGHRPSRVRLGMPSAALPPGRHITRRGSGHWHVLPGTTPKVGTGKKVYTYTVEVEGGLDPAEYGGNKAFARTVEQTLADSRSWVGGGRVAFRRVASARPRPDIRISMTSPATDHREKVCGYQIHYETSCYRSDRHQVVINLARWVRGAASFGDDMRRYRQYVVNHEIGHALGHGHTGCRRQGGPAPVMMEQTFGLSDDYVHKLNAMTSGADDAVPADGKSCTPNPWPHPPGPRGSARGRSSHARPGR